MNLPEGMVLLDREALHPRIQERELDIVTCPTSVLPDAWVQQIVDKTRQPHVMEFEGHEDVGTEEVPGRYRDIPNFRLWADGKARQGYYLVDFARDPAENEVPDIGANTWYGQRQHPLAPGCEVTYAVRHYAGDEERGWGNYYQAGLGSPFMQATMADLPKRIDMTTGVWLDLVEGNIPAENMYRNNGFEVIDRFADPDHGGQRRILMVNHAILGANREQ